MDSWKSIQIRSFLNELPKSTFQVQHADNVGPYPFFTSGEKILKHSVFNIDDAVIFLATGGKANVKFFNGEAAYSTDTYAVNCEVEDTEYFYYFLLSKIYFIERNFFSGSGLKHLQKRDFKDWFIEIPSDVNEQRLIAKIIQTVDKAITATEQLVTKYQRIKTGLLHDLLKTGIDKEGKLRSELTHEFKDSPMGRIPVDWTCKPLGEIYADIKSGSTPLRRNKSYFENGIHLWAKTLDLNEGEITNTQEKITDIAISESSCNVFPIDSILIAMYGGWEQIGRTGILKKEAATNQALSALFNPKMDISPEYVQFFLQYFRYKWKLYAVSTRKDPNITKTDIQNFQIFFPKDKDEQLKVVSAIQNCNKNIHYTTQNLTKLQSLKTGLMQDLLSGNVRVDMKNINKQYGTKN